MNLEIQGLQTVFLETFSGKSDSSNTYEIKRNIPLLADGFSHKENLLGLSFRDHFHSLLMQQGVQAWNGNEEFLKQIFCNLFFDELTELPNRKLFISLLEHRLTSSLATQNYDFAVLVLDLDRFKAINDSLGYEIGDQLLIEAGRRMVQSLRDVDIVARLGSDEFGILLNRVDSLQEVTSIADRLAEVIEASFTIKGNTVFTNISLGIALGVPLYRQAEELLRDADTAMHHAKFQDKVHYQVFNREMHLQAVKTLQIENDLRQAIEHNDLSLVYQPIFSLKDPQVIGFEALARWQHQDIGVVSPVDFISIAEKCGLIIPLGNWILREACKELAVLKRKSSLHEKFSVHINISGRQLTHPDFIRTLKSVLRENKLEPKDIKLEITESTLLDSSTYILSVIKQLKKLGIGLSMDDFGTGYSSLSYLHKFAFDTLKIDRSFLQNTSSQSIEIIHSIVTLAHSLGMDVIAEGIESDSHLNQLQILKCDFGQGYLFSQPLIPHELETFLNRQNPLAAAPRFLRANDTRLLNWSKQQLVTHIEQLQREVECLQQENLDLNILLEATAEHSELLESELQREITNYKETEAALQQANRVLETLAMQDELTKVDNRRRFDGCLGSLWQKLLREQAMLSLILLDVDHFKIYNDVYGHPKGDACLYRVAQAIRAAISVDEAVVARYGGEEFSIILPYADVQTATATASVINAQIQALSIPHIQSPVSEFVTVSQGIVCTIPSAKLSPSKLIQLADEALYQAKANGRNRFCLIQNIWGNQ